MGPVQKVILASPKGRTLSGQTLQQFAEMGQNLSTAVKDGGHSGWTPHPDPARKKTISTSYALGILQHKLYSLVCWRDSVQHLQTSTHGRKTNLVLLFETG